MSRTEVGLACGLGPSNYRIKKARNSLHDDGILGTENDQVAGDSAALFASISEWGSGNKPPKEHCLADGLHSPAEINVEVIVIVKIPNGLGA
jgi:hypothetical protein